MADNPKKDNPAAHSMVELSPLDTLTYCLLLGAIVALWLPIGRIASVVLLFAATGAGLTAGILSWAAPPAIIVFGVTCQLAESRIAAGSVGRAAGVVLVVLLGFAFGLHVVPGFDRVPIMEQVRVSDAAPAFSQYLNFDKALVGLLLLLTYAGLIRRGRDWQAMLRAGMPYAATTVVVVVALALLSGFVKWDPKFTELFLPWAVVNLFFACVAEEAFFRGFLQRHLSASLPARLKPQWLAAVAIGVLFGVAHVGGGKTYALLATCAGIGYGAVYAVTGRIEASIMTHFLVNATHFLLLSYPRYLPAPL